MIIMDMIIMSISIIIIIISLLMMVMMGTIAHPEIVDIGLHESTGNQVERRNENATQGLSCDVGRNAKMRWKEVGKLEYVLSGEGIGRSTGSESRECEEEEGARGK